MTRPDIRGVKVAVNRGISVATIADAVRQPYITEDGVLNLTAIWLVHRTSRLASRIKKRPADDWSDLFSCTTSSASPRRLGCSRNCPDKSV